MKLRIESDEEVENVDGSRDESGDGETKGRPTQAAACNLGEIWTVLLSTHFEGASTRALRDAQILTMLDLTFRLVPNSRHPTPELVDMVTFAGSNGRTVEYKYDKNQQAHWEHVE